MQAYVEKDSEKFQNVKINILIKKLLERERESKEAAQCSKIVFKLCESSFYAC